MLQIIVLFAFLLLSGGLIYILDPILMIGEFQNKLETFFPTGGTIEEYEEDVIDEVIGLYKYIKGNVLISVFFLPFVLKTLFFHKMNPITTSTGFDAIQPRGFQTPESANMELLIETHNLIFTYCVFIFIFVTIFLGVTVYFYKTGGKKVGSTMEEWFRIYEKGIKRKEGSELYFYDQYGILVSSDGVDFISDKGYKINYSSRWNYQWFQIWNKMVYNKKYEEEKQKKAVIEDAKEILQSLLPEKLAIIEDTKILLLSKSLIKKNEIKNEIKNENELGYEFIRSILQKVEERSVSNRSRKKVWDNLIVEVVWTLIPTLILVAIAIPSFTLLYALEPTVFYDTNTVFVKIIGHQWYWTYEFPKETFNLLQKKGNIPEGIEASFSSYMLPTTELKDGMPRLLSVDNSLYLPINSNIIIRVTSEDVIHSWAIPALGIKLDCIPGRINEFVFRIRSVGDLYGQCSELCGVNHGFMPIHIIAYEN